MSSTESHHEWVNPMPLTAASELPDLRDWRQLEQPAPPDDEVQRLLDLCEAPSQLWVVLQDNVRPEEPFGMIA